MRTGVAPSPLLQRMNRVLLTTPKSKFRRLSIWRWDGLSPNFGVRARNNGTLSISCSSVCTRGWRTHGRHRWWRTGSADETPGRCEVPGHQAQIHISKETAVTPQPETSYAATLQAGWVPIIQTGCGQLSYCVPSQDFWLFAIFLACHGRPFVISFPRNSSRGTGFPVIQTRNPQLETHRAGPQSLRSLHPPRSSVTTFTIEPHQGERNGYLQAMWWNGRDWLYSVLWFRAPRQLSEPRGLRALWW